LFSFNQSDAKKNPLQNEKKKKKLFTTRFNVTEFCANSFKFHQYSKHPRCRKLNIETVPARAKIKNRHFHTLTKALQHSVTTPIIDYLVQILIFFLHTELKRVHGREKKFKKTKKPKFEE